MGISFVFTSLDYRAAVPVSLFAKRNVLRGCEEMFFTYAVAFFMASAAEGVGAVMVVVDEVAFGAGKFEVGAVLAKGCILSSSMCSKSNVVMGELRFGMFFGEEGFSHRVEYMD